MMKNHLHLLVEVKGVSLSKIMQVLQFRYTRYFNKRYTKVGHLFQGRYKAILCDKEQYLLELIHYIHLNPVRAGIVEVPEKYPWSGHLGYSSKVKDDPIHPDFVLGQLGKNRTVARRRYRQYVLDGMNMGHEEK
ncbi:MAG: transposase [Deltaproteobacteria bacterium]|nr:transposase [Deltaproteobacteria bacterium]